MAAVDHARKRILAAVDSPLPVRVQIGSAGNLRLHPHENILADDGLVAAFHIILRPLTVVGTALLIQNADRECLLQKGIANVLLIGENLMDIALMPFQMSRSVRNTVCFQASPDLQEACPFQELPVDTADDFSLCRVNNQIALRVLGVT